MRKRFELGDLVPTSFLTLTQRDTDPTDIDAAWNRWITAMRRQGYQLRYFRVKEFTRRGKRHIHVLIEGFWPYTETSRLWCLATGGSSVITKVVRIHDPRIAANYITKYLTKALDSYFLPGERRYSASRGVLLPPVRSADSWHVYIYKAGAGYIGIGPDRRRIERIDDWLEAVKRLFIKQLRLRSSAWSPEQTLICS